MSILPNTEAYNEARIVVHHKETRDRAWDLFMQHNTDKMSPEERLDLAIRCVNTACIFAQGYRIVRIAANKELKKTEDSAGDGIW